MAPRPPRRALVIGGSVGGLFAALLLRQAGWVVEVFERVAAPLAGRGAGIVTHPQLWRILERLGLDPHHGFGIPVAERLTLAQDGSVAGRRDFPQTMTSWDRLFRMLRAALPSECYTKGADLCRIEQQAGAVRAYFANGRVTEGEVLVGADGFRSTVRDVLLGGIAPQYAGYVAWRGLVPEAAMPPASAMLFDTFGFCLPPGEQILGYPVAGEDNDLRPGHRRYNIVWYRPADEATALPDLLTDEAGHTHHLSIPPPLIRPAVVVAMRADAARILAPAFAQAVAAIPQPFLQPVYDLESPRMAVGRVALLGDSAFLVRPHVGAGVTKAAEDAACLAEVLASAADVAEALAQYEAARLVAGQRIIRRARHLGAYMQARIDTEEQRAAAVRHHTAEAVMAETALLDF